MMVAVILFLGVTYVILGLVAYPHVVGDSVPDKMCAAGPWWATYSRVYDDTGRKLCK